MTEGELGFVVKEEKKCMVDPKVFGSVSSFNGKLRGSEVDQEIIPFSVNL